MLSSEPQTGHFVCNTLRGRVISAKMKRLESSKNSKNHISSDELPSGMEKTVWSGLLRGTHIFIRHWCSPFWCLDSKVTACFIVTYTCSNDSSGQLVIPPGNARKSREAGHKRGQLSAQPDLKGPGRPPLPPPLYPLLTYTTRSFIPRRRVSGQVLHTYYEPETVFWGPLHR